MRYFELPSPLIFQITGKHSQRYLNARLTNNIKDLSVGKACVAGMLTPQGKTEGVFCCIRLEAEKFLLYSDGGSPDEIIVALKRYIVADQVVVEDLSSLFQLIHLAGISSDNLNEIFKSDAPTLQTELFVIPTSNHIGVLRNRGLSIGVDIIVKKEDYELLSGLLDEKISDDEVTLDRIKGNKPAFPSDILAESMFMEAGMLNTISFTKGCYVGQEVIERVDAMGKAPKLMKRAVFEGSTKIPSGTPVYASELDSDGDLTKIGNILSSAPDSSNNSTLSFIVTKNDPSLDGVSIITKTDPKLSGRIIFSSEPL